MLLDGTNYFNTDLRSHLHLNVQSEGIVQFNLYFYINKVIWIGFISYKLQITVFRIF